MKLKKPTWWILSLLAKLLMKISVAGSRDNFKYTLLSSDNPIQNMIKLYPIQFITNVICTLFLITALVIIEKVISPVQRGFFCEDHSIMKPYVTKQTIPAWLLGVICAIFVLSVVSGTEYFVNSKKDELCKEQTGHIYIGNMKLKPWIYRIISQLCFIFIGYIMNVLFTGIGKKCVGRLRPHFMSVCRPDYSKFNCSAGYITADVCTTTNTASLYQARLSFPSGHSSTSAYAAVVLALYIEYAIPVKRFYLIKPTTQFLSICLGVACGFSRISDYWHHWSDVLTGLVIGTVFACYTIFGLMKLHHTTSFNFIQVKRDADQQNDIETGQPNTSYDNNERYYGTTTT